MSYSSVNYETFGNIKNIPANKARVIKAGVPVITFTDMFGRNFYSVKMGKYVNESKLRKELRDTFGFSKSNIDSILSIH